MKKNWFVVGFIGIVLLALFVRLYHVTQFPPSLYGEEIALGYDAFSILKTGKDHFGNTFPIIAFPSFDDYKPALYFYLIVPMMAVFGVNELAVRLPSVIAGVLLVVGTGMIGRQLLRRVGYADSAAQKFQLLVMILLAISPWAVIFSRGGWEVNVATCLLTWGVATGGWVYEKLPVWKNDPVIKNLFRAAVPFLFLAFSMYTYHAARFIAPMLGLALLRLWSQPLGIFNNWRRSLFSYLKLAIPVGLFFVLLIMPLLLSLRDHSTQERFAETNYFADAHVAKESNACRDETGNTVASRLFCHRYFFYSKEFLQNYFTHFSLQFLFVSGDANFRHSVQYFGQLYLTESIFLVIGLIFLLRRWRALTSLLVFWLLIGVVPAALTIPTPHALRILPTMPVFILLIAVGVWESTLLLSTAVQRLHLPRLRWILPVALIAGSYFVQFTAFWHFYQDVYSKLYFGAWQYGYREVVEEVNRRKSSVEHVAITREMDRPAMAYWFFSQTDPRQVQTIDHQLQLDNGPIFHFQNIDFVNGVAQAKNGVVASSVQSMNAAEAAGHKITNITEIKDPAGKPYWAVYNYD